MKEADVQITILTPTHNRVQLLKRLYTSLINQKISTNVSVQWLVGVDDSTDGTVEWLRQISKHKFENVGVTFFEFEGIGKHRVLNRLQKSIIGKVVAIVDDDDYLTSDAIETILNDWDNNQTLDEIDYLRTNMDTGEPFKEFPNGGGYADVFSERYHVALWGDYFETFSTEHFSKLVFPEFHGENFVTEATKWLPLSKNANGLFINKGIYLAKYLPGGLTDKYDQKLIENPQGAMYFERLIANEKTFTFKRRMKAAANYRKYEKMRNVGIKVFAFDSVILNIMSFIVEDLRNLKNKVN